MFSMFLICRFVQYSYSHDFCDSPESHQLHHIKVFLSLGHPYEAKISKEKIVNGLRKFPKTDL